VALIKQLKAEAVPAIFGSEVFPSKVLDQIGREAGVKFVDTLRDDDLPGETNAPSTPTSGMKENVRLWRGCWGRPVAEEHRSIQRGDRTGQVVPNHLAILEACSRITALSAGAKPISPVVSFVSKVPGLAARSGLPRAGRLQARCISDRRRRRHHLPMTPARFPKFRDAVQQLVPRRRGPKAPSVEQSESQRAKQPESASEPERPGHRPQKP
jgi:hypothetical protein